jgi:hypothetical protein
MWYGIFRAEKNLTIKSGYFVLWRSERNWVRTFSALAHSIRQLRPLAWGRSRDACSSLAGPIVPGQTGRCPAGSPRRSSAPRNLLEKALAHLFGEGRAGIAAAKRWRSSQTHGSMIDVLRAQDIRQRRPNPKAEDARRCLRSTGSRWRPGLRVLFCCRIYFEPGWAAGHTVGGPF